MWFRVRYSTQLVNTMLCPRMKNHHYGELNTDTAARVLRFFFFDLLAVIFFLFFLFLKLWSMRQSSAHVTHELAGEDTCPKQWRIHQWNAAPDWAGGYEERVDWLLKLWSETVKENLTLQIHVGAIVQVLWQPETNKGFTTAYLFFLLETFYS